ncbi:MAG: SET domain-containing protein-lysine N-methyltransferase [Saprospiraceae bacterium]|nr:SET domain-containing protein-lysine N-methyltransferase [Saprospiraceae bacterium]
MDQIILSKDLHWEKVALCEKNFELKKANENNAHGLFANKNFKKGEFMFQFRSKNIVSRPTYLTVQMDDNKHFSLDPDFLQYMNHSCDPNVFLDTKDLSLTAIKPINKGEELSFFYPSSEWDMEQPFICNCGALECQRYIAGAHSMKTEALEKYRLNEYIKRKLGEAR